METPQIHRERNGSKFCTYNWWGNLHPSNSVVYHPYMNHTEGIRWSFEILPAQDAPPNVAHIISYIPYVQYGKISSGLAWLESWFHDGHISSLKVLDIRFNFWAGDALAKFKSHPRTSCLWFMMNVSLGMIFSYICTKLYEHLWDSQRTAATLTLQTSDSCTPQVSAQY